MEAKIAAWDSHPWTIRELELDPGITLMQHICERCGRNFVVELGTGDQYAVHVSAVRFDRLSEEITSRWVAAPCPGERLKSDEIDLKTRFTSLAAEADALTALPVRLMRSRVSPISDGVDIRRRRRV